MDLFENILYIPKLYYGALLAVGFCIYYFCEVVKVSRHDASFTIPNQPLIAFNEDSYVMRDTFL